MKKIQKSYLIFILLLSFTVHAEQENPNKVPVLEKSSESIPVVDSAENIKEGLPITAKPESEAVKEEKITASQLSTPVQPAVFVHTVKGKMSKIYKRLFMGLENNGYYVIFEPNIGRNLAHFAKRWGKDYNVNKIESIRSMVFCNGWYANKVSNVDPDMLALCPLHITLTHKAGITKVLFIKPAHISQGSPANSIAFELEQDVIRIIKESAR